MNKLQEKITLNTDSINPHNIYDIKKHFITYQNGNNNIRYQVTDNFLDIGEIIEYIKGKIVKYSKEIQTMFYKSQSNRFDEN